MTWTSASWLNRSDISPGIVPNTKTSELGSLMGGKENI
jgi:hypothetical protein